MISRESTVSGTLPAKSSDSAVSRQLSAERPTTRLPGYLSAIRLRDKAAAASQDLRSLNVLPAATACSTASRLNLAGQPAAANGQCRGQAARSPDSCNSTQPPTTNLFGALNVGSGQVCGECHPTRDGAQFLAFCKAAVKPHAGKDIHIVLDNLSTHTTADVQQWLTDNPHVHFHFTPVGSSWMNQIETWFGIITRQSIRRGTFTSVTVLIKTIRDYIAHWNADAQPFTWTATAHEILAKVALTQTAVKQLVNNNAK